MNKTVLKLFGAAIATKEKGSQVANAHKFSQVNETAVTLGYVVHPDICNAEVLEWLLSQKRDYNSTFYKKWNDVISKSRFELFIDQLLHYASTYGTNHTGEVYLPAGEVEVPEFTKFKVISPITTEEVIERCEKMLFSGIAMKQETIEDVLLILNELDYRIDIDKVKNKEAKMFLYKQTGALPSDPVEMVRLLVYLAIGKTLLIKDGRTIAEIKVAQVNVTQFIEAFGMEKLSSVFYRFKPIFLAFKKGNDTYCINKLRRLAVKNHVPLEPSFFETILITHPKKLIDLPKALGGLSNFKKIALLQTILIRMKGLDVRAFGIRNQKLYIKEQGLRVDKGYLQMVYDIIYADLVASLREKACWVKLPEGVNITLPTSEKSFIGNYPLGTSFDFSDSDNIVGINWRSEDGAEDLDLKLIDINGTQYGWNAAYYNDERSIVFSGDMTSAHPEATELFYTSKGFNPAIVKVNLFSGASDSKFKLFIAKEKVVNMKENYMVNPDNIIVNVDCQMDSAEKSLGVITDSKFILAQFRTGSGRVAGDSVTNAYTDYALKTLDCYLSLKKLLTDAGFKIASPKSTAKAAIDLTELSKDTLINLLSK